MSAFGSTSVASTAQYLVLEIMIINYRTEIYQIMRMKWCNPMPPSRTIFISTILVMIVI